jgi:hypothetical protein
MAIFGVHGTRGRLPSHRRRPVRNQAVSPSDRTGDSMTSKSELAWALADAVSVCFTGRDRLGIYTALGAGETYTAIETMLDINHRRAHGQGKPRHPVTDREMVTSTET